MKKDFTKSQKKLLDKVVDDLKEVEGTADTRLKAVANMTDAGKVQVSYKFTYTKAGNNKQWLDNIDKQLTGLGYESIECRGSRRIADGTKLFIAGTWLEPARKRGKRVEKLQELAEQAVLTELECAVQHIWENGLYGEATHEEVFGENWKDVQKYEPDLEKAYTDIMSEVLDQTREIARVTVLEYFEGFAERSKGVKRG